MTTLRQRMIDDLRVRNRSAHTIRIYTDCIANFARHFGKSPELLGPEEIRQYQVYLVNERHVSCSYLTQTVCALRFLYCVTLQRDWAITRIPHPKQPRRLPIVLSQTEVKQLFESIRNLKYRALLMTAYAGGLRTSEVVSLRLTDIDSERMVIRIRQGKGQKDRYVMLAPTLLKVLRQYWQQERPTTWLFPGQDSKQRHVMQVVDCSNCGTKKRVDESKLATREAVCGRCGAKLTAATGAVELEPVIITDQSFASEVLQVTGRTVLVDCWAPWCGPRRMIAPVMDQLASEAQGAYRVAKLNVDENPETSSRFQISSIPTMLIFKNGKVVDRLIGVQPKQAIAERLRVASRAAA